MEGYAPPARKVAVYLLPGSCHRRSAPGLCRMLLHPEGHLVCYYCKSPYLYLSIPMQINVNGMQTISNNNTILHEGAMQVQGWNSVRFCGGFGEIWPKGEWEPVAARTRWGGQTSRQACLFWWTAQAVGWLLQPPNWWHNTLICLQVYSYLWSRYQQINQQFRLMPYVASGTILTFRVTIVLRLAGFVLFFSPESEKLGAASSAYLALPISRLNIP